MNKSYLYGDLTSAILNAYRRVFWQLSKRYGYSEHNYREALAIELRNRELEVDQEVTVPRYYLGQPIGENRLDLVVNDTVVLELKKLNRLLGAKDCTQLRTYLQDSGYVVGLVLNFGYSCPDAKRCEERSNLRQ